jgi:hypothetical protein
VRKTFAFDKNKKQVLIGDKVKYNNRENLYEIVDIVDFHGKIFIGIDMIHKKNLFYVEEDKIQK